MKKIEVYKLSNGEIVEGYEEAFLKQKELSFDNDLGQFVIKHLAGFNSSTRVKNALFNNKEEVAKLFAPFLKREIEKGVLYEVKEDDRDDLPWDGYDDVCPHCGGDEITVTDAEFNELTCDKCNATIQPIERKDFNYDEVDYKLQYDRLMMIV